MTKKERIKLKIHSHCSRLFSVCQYDFRKCFGSSGEMVLLLLICMCVCVCWCQFGQNYSSTIHSILAGENYLNHNLEFEPKQYNSFVALFIFEQLKLSPIALADSGNAIQHSHIHRYMYSHWLTSQAKLSASIACNVPTVLWIAIPQYSHTQMRWNQRETLRKRHSTEQHKSHQTKPQRKD